MKRMATLAAFVAAFSFFCGATTETGVVEARAAARQSVRHSETRTRGSALRPGDCIGVVAPASWLEREEWEKGVRLLKKRGYRVKLAPSCTAANGFFAGTDSARASDLNRFFADDEVKAILCLRGGYGSARVLDKLNYAGRPSAVAATFGTVAPSPLKRHQPTTPADAVPTMQHTATQALPNHISLFIFDRLSSFSRTATAARRKQMQFYVA